MQHTVRPAVVFLFHPVFFIQLTLPELTLPLILFYRNCINGISMLKIRGTLRKKGIRLFSVQVYISTAMQRNPEMELKSKQ